MRIVTPAEFVRANPVILGSEAPEDMTDFWYVIARGERDEIVSVDCHQTRLGRCYDSFWDRHGVVGSCAVIALSFAELLERLLQSNGRDLYWLSKSWGGYGDAYDALISSP